MRDLPSHPNIQHTITDCTCSRVREGVLQMHDGDGSWAARTRLAELADPNVAHTWLWRHNRTRRSASPASILSGQNSHCVSVSGCDVRVVTCMWMRVVCECVCPVMSVCLCVRACMYICVSNWFLVLASIEFGVPLAHFIGSLFLVEAPRERPCV